MAEITRRRSREVKIGKVAIGASNPIAVQSMTFTKTSDKEATLAQIQSLEKAGCDIVRFSVPDEESAKNISYFKENSTIPLVADIHFNYRLALIAAEQGIDKIRINPGNIVDRDRVAVQSVFRKIAVQGIKRATLDHRERRLHCMLLAASAGAVILQAVYNHFFATCP
jgi:(E)-4-hydroxy-3-methylbut-2-enyl-diphosphate synthase